MVEEMEECMSYFFRRMTDCSVVNEYEFSIIINDAVSGMEVTVEGADTKQVSAVNPEELEQEIPSECFFFNPLLKGHALDKF